MGRSRKPKVEKIPLSWAVCNEGDDIVKKLVAEHHQHLRGVSIDVYLQSTDIKDKGRKIVAKSVKIAGLNSFLAMKSEEGEPWPFFVICVNGAAWGAIDEKTREAVLDEQLCTMARDDKGKLSFKCADASIFRGNLERYGLWADNLKLAGRTIAGLQASLDLVEGGAPAHGKGAA